MVCDSFHFIISRVKGIDKWDVADGLIVNVAKNITYANWMISFDIS